MNTAARLLLALVVGVALVSPAAAKKPKYGVFGKVNGKKFKAKSNGRPDDNCVYGTYVAVGGLNFTAGECHGKRQKMPNKNFAQVIFRCGVEASPQTPPYEAACTVAAYVEAHVEGDQASDEKAWLSSVTTLPGAEGTTIRQSGIHLRVDSFDGTYVKGAFSGVFDLPQVAGLAPVSVSGEVRFFFPVELE